MTDTNARIVTARVIAPILLLLPTSLYRPALRLMLWWGTR